MADAKAQKRQKFDNVFPKLREELLAYLNQEGMPQDAVSWFQRNLDYNVPGGKLNRGISVVDSVEILKGRKLNDDEYFKAALLGWCVEFLQAFFLVSDDMMDQSVTRRGQPCWFRVEGINLIAINDSFMLEGAIYYLLKKHFRSEPYYVHLLELFHDTTFQTEIGQLIDLITAPEDHVDLSKFSLAKHQKIVIYKTAYYSFYLPVALAMYTCGVPHAPANDPYALAQSILIPLGEYFQVQDDFLDFAAPPEVLGKVGTDIVDNKCSWCVNAALARASPAQRRVLDDNYGLKDKEAEARVKALYEELGIRDEFAAYEERAYARIVGLIETIPAEGADVGAGDVRLKREVFKAFLDKIYKRQK
uniref:Farnesyl pyrophosphate synthase n=1 Tax=Ganoderma lucidum TaxID=5315 RepID=ERG20_GANLU|nr:RecName: Full=Farnesyl pyrophosphate synthase; Short=FPP synthase; Short=FPS; AltName: Full=(2E,6E)-farnesyl diphosphate synthase; AltName: Full=Dimethylallyltranstransferase; AltName: Full=Farnesyl diphosphate synthase; AltName: Full=Geranyltranstransferase [Ganoderma lucidum]ACB37020.1 farnesyl-diphosphate synthase [Ganoderma lucidum]ACB37021.1 farnesyl-diphosphate synthase [Ganoderma lucidum]